ncbi:MAG: restriction endonuclease subunit S [Blastocatellia bacterium]
MASEWIETTIGDQLTLQRGFDITKAQQNLGNIPVISSGGVASYHDVAMVEGPGVVLGRKGTVGTVFFIENDYWPHDTTLWVKDFKNNDRRFVYYFFVSFAKHLASLDVGSANPTLNRNHIHPIPVRWPPKEEQYEIAKALAMLDDKIELNRRMNATLEAMAQALFKSWFVDFDPVKAKAEGRAPEGMDAETAALFPSEFQDSELGQIPKGWRCLSLDEAFEINPSRKLAKGAEASYLDMANVTTQGHRPTGWIKRAFSSGTKFINGDTLLARITPCLENGKTAFVDFLPNDETGWGSTEFIVMRPKPPLPEYFAYLLCRESDFRSFAIQSMTGTSGRQRVQVDSLGKYPLAVPVDMIANRFGAIIAPLVMKISRNSEEARSLAVIRDALLPKLISGQLRIPEAEEVAAAAM